jgi:hypothetical protein
MLSDRRAEPRLGDKGVKLGAWPRRLAQVVQRARREGSFGERLKVFFMRRVLFNVWRVAERLGIRLATEGPTYAPSDAQCEEMDALVTRARAEGGVIDASSTAFPAHELLTHLVERHGLLLHGTNHTELDVIEPRPGRDFGTHVEAVAAADDGIWPLFYAVVARERVDGVFTACMHLGRRPSLRRFYAFRVFGADPYEETTWTQGAVYAVPRSGFWREWGNEWLRTSQVTPVLRVLVGPSDFPLRHAVARG